MPSTDASPFQPATDILLVSINARYGHSAFAARCLAAGLGGESDRISIHETDLDATPFQIAAEIVACRPRLVGFSVYLWNVRTVRETLAILRKIVPRIRTVVGGPEIVHGSGGAWEGLADAWVVGEGETAFRRLAAEFRPGEVVAEAEDVNALRLPYGLYDDTDVARRMIYVETSRGCPFGCAYCTSGDSGLRLFSLERLFPAFDGLLERGVRAFRFLDRSFNADEAHAGEVLEFFLSRRPARLQLHFEIMPCRLGGRLRERLASFPPGVLHLEVGVQTLNAEVARRVGRPGDPDVVMETVGFLMREARANVHADLIFGLPGEDETSFAAGFDRLVSTLDPPELQVNILKRLPGTPLATDPRYSGLSFNPNPPYELLAGDALDFETVVRMQQFARCWERVHNRGRFPLAASRVWQGEGASAYARYMALAGRIQAAEGRMHAIGADRLAGHLERFLREECGLSAVEASATVADRQADSRPALGPGRGTGRAREE